MKITEDVFALDATRGTYVYLIRGEENMLVDTGLFFQRGRLLKELRALGAEPESIRQIFLTHHDADHIGNSIALQRISHAHVWVSEEDRPYIEGTVKRPGIKRWISMGMKGPEHLDTYPKDARFGEVEVIPTPGHTPGHVCLFYRDVLFLGDLAANRKEKWETSQTIMTWDPKAVQESIRKVAALPFHWLCPAHGKPVERGKDWERFVEDVRKS